MARKGRIEFAGALYHVLDRGDRRESIVRGDRDKDAFIRTLGEACARTGWRVHAFVLMSNHYHLLIETPQPNLVAGMRWFQTTWTVRFNRYHGLSGHLFQGRYKAVVIDPEAESYLVTLSDYIHLNPVRAGIVGLDDKLFSYRWSSYPWYVATAGRPLWFEPSRALSELGWADDKPGRREYAERMRARAVDERQKDSFAVREQLDRGWCLGSPGFRERLLRLLDKTGNGQLSQREVDGSLRRSHDEDHAERLLVRGLELCGLTAEELPRLRKNEPRKAAIASLIRHHTAVPNAWIAAKLHLGHVSRVSRCYSQAAPLSQKLEQALAQETARFTD